MTSQIILSNSSIQTFKQCRRKYWLEHYRRLKSKQQEYIGPLALGSRIHKALEVYYARMGAGQTSAQADLLGIWADLSDYDRWDFPEGFVDENAYDAEAELGRVMLEGYLQWIEDEGIDSELDILSQEERLEADMLEGRVKLVGKIDQRVKRTLDGSRWIRDFKTAASFTDIYKTIQMNEQFLTYMVLEMLNGIDEDSRVGGAIVTALRKNKRTSAARPPFYEQLEVEHNLFELRNFFMRLQGELRAIVGMVDALDAGEDHHVVAYPSPSRDCSWRCPFYAACPMFDDGSDVERYIADNYDEGDPFDYYGAASPTPVTS